MKLLTPFLPLAAAAYLGWSVVYAAAAEPLPSWSFRLSVAEKELPAPVQEQWRKTFRPVLGRLKETPFLKKLGWVNAAAYGAGDAEVPDLIVHFHFQDDAAVKEMREKFHAASGTQWEEIAGLRVLERRREPAGSEGRRGAYLVHLDERNLALCTSRAMVERLAAARESFRGEPNPDEILSADFEGKALQTMAEDSHLLNLIDRRLGVAIYAGREYFLVEGWAEISDTRAVKRARRLLEGYIATLALDRSAEKEPPLDERLEISAEGARLKARLKLTPGEVSRMLVELEKDLARELKVDNEK